MVEERELSPGQQTIIRSLTAQRDRAIALHNDAIALYLEMLKTKLGLGGDWAFAGTMDAINLVLAPETPPKEPSE